MVRQACLLCAILSFTACAHKAPPPAPPARVPTGQIIGGFKLNAAGNVERQLTASEVEALRRRDQGKGR